jgi:hypothetical protein
LALNSRGNPRFSRRFRMIRVSSNPAIFAPNYAELCAILRSGDRLGDRKYFHFAGGSFIREVPVKFSIHSHEL